jgi:hypothetical protein
MENPEDVDVMPTKNNNDKEKEEEKEELIEISGVELMVAITGYYFMKLWQEGKFDDIIKDVQERMKKEKEEEGTFSKQKLKNKKIQERKGYHLNTKTYELEEC